MGYIFRLHWWKDHVKPKLQYIYDINGMKAFGYGNVRIYLTNTKADELTPSEKEQLKKIRDFYEVLNGIEEDRIRMLYNSIYYDSEYFKQKAEEYEKESGGKGFFIYLDWCGNGMEQCSYGIVYDDIEDKVRYVHEEPYEDWYDDKGEIRGELTRPEFNLLMQIYYGVYDDERLKRELEEKEKKGEYDKIKQYLDVDKMDKIFNTKEESILEEDKKLLEKYLKLQLMRKDTTGAFPGLKIRKIYDADWPEEEQRRVIEKINKELGKEVVILE